VRAGPFTVASFCVMGGMVPLTPRAMAGSGIRVARGSPWALECWHAHLQDFPVAASLPAALITHPCGGDRAAAPPCEGFFHVTERTPTRRAGQ
jgi:hypothetical protein